MGDFLRHVVQANGRRVGAANPARVDALFAGSYSDHIHRAAWTDQAALYARWQFHVTIALRRDTMERAHEFVGGVQFLGLPRSVVYGAIRSAACRLGLVTTSLTPLLGVLPEPGPLSTSPALEEPPTQRAPTRRGSPAGLRGLAYRRGRLAVSSRGRGSSRAHGVPMLQTVHAPDRELDSPYDRWQTGEAQRCPSWRPSTGRGAQGREPGRLCGDPACGRAWRTGQRSCRDAWPPTGRSSEGPPFCV